MEGHADKGDMDENQQMKTWEVVLGIVIMFLVVSASLFWYGHFDKTRQHSIENEMRLKWEKDTQKWQKDATDNINGVRKSQQQVLDVLNFNFTNGRLIMPKQEKK